MATLAGQPTHHQPTTVEEVRTLWIGDLQYWVDESYLNSCFAHTGEVRLLVSFLSFFLYYYFCNFGVEW